MNKEYLDLFSQKAEYYDKYRPKYSEQFVKYIVDNGILSKEMTIADIGCGTGILTCQVIPYVQTVYGIEPNLSMLKIATEKLSMEEGFIPANTVAENTGLASDSLDCILVGQAFHWFDVHDFKKEAFHILRRGGKVVLVWNKKQDCYMESVRKSIVDKYRGIKDYYDSSWNRRKEGIAVFFNNYFSTVSFDNPIIESENHFIFRTLSASHAIDVNDKRIEYYLNDWRDYFHRFEKDGIISIPNQTIAYIGEVIYSE